MLAKLRSKKIKNIQIILIFVGVAIFSVGGFYWATHTTCLALQDILIDIPKNPYLSRKKILSLTGVPIGQNIFRIDLDAIRARIEAEPWVAKAFVSRKLPNKLFIRIKIEEPIAIVATAKGLYLVNSQGSLFAPATNKILEDFPIIVGITKGEEAARKLSPKHISLLKLLAYLRHKDELVPCYVNLSQIKLLEEGFVLITRDALQVRFPKGDFQTLIRCYRKLDRIFEYLYDTNQYAYTKMIRLDYPQGKAAIIFKKG